MSIKAILFDLDGTLVPMDQEFFIKLYFKSLAEYMKPYGYESESFIASMWRSIKTMMKNDGNDINERVFWSDFEKIYGERAKKDREHIDDFYKHDFIKTKVACGYSEHAKETVELAKSLGFRVVLATNPVFPRIATESRIAWAGCVPEDFELITTYENSSYSKPSLGYYREILKKLELLPEECLMVGNDTRDDMSANELGMNVFLLTDCLINENNVDISKYPHGSFFELCEYIKNLKENN